MLKFFTLRKSNVITAVNHQNYLFKPSFHVFHISVDQCEVKDKNKQEILGYLMFYLSTKEDIFCNVCLCRL